MKAPVVAGVALLATCWGAVAAAPPRPKSMPPNAIWVPGPNAPLDRTPRGVWVGCWLDRVKNVNHCRVTDHGGRVEFDEDFVPVVGSGPVKEELLRLRSIGTMELWTWVEEDSRDVPVVRLVDGTILVPARDAEALRGRYAEKRK